MTTEIRHTDKLAAVLLLGLSAGVFVVSRDFPEGFGGTPGAAFFPRVVAGAIAALAVVLLARSLASRDSRAHRVSVGDAAAFALPVGLLVGYVVAMQFVGFVAATVAFLVALMRYSGVEAYRTSVSLGVGVAIVLHYVFGEFLHVPLPEGSIVGIAEILPSLPLLAGVWG